MNDKNITVIQNPNKEYTKAIKKKLADNNGYCPCKIVKTDDTKCMCKEFRDMIESGETGECHCGLYVITENN